MATGEAGEVEREGRTIVRRRWSAQDRIDALAVLASCGGNVEEASRQTGVPPRTLAFWRDRPASGQDRAALAVREELLSQSLERLLWRLARSAKGKVADAKLAQVLGGFAVVFDRWKTLRDRAGSGAANAGATGGLNLDTLSSDELRTLLGLIAKAGGKVTPREVTAGGNEVVVRHPGGLGLGCGDDPDSASVVTSGADGGCEPGERLVVVSAAEVLGEGAVGVPERPVAEGIPPLSGNPNSNDLGL